MNRLHLQSAALPCALLLALSLSGCATAPHAQPDQQGHSNTSATAGSNSSTTTPSAAPASASGGTAAEVGKAVTSPLGDLNLIRADIPAVLAAAKQAPYAVPTDRSCTALADQVRALDAVLGADLDTPATDKNPSLIERGAGAAKKGAIGAVQGAAEGVVPMRSWVRKLTGAEKYAREVEASITAGTIRRSYLKGLGHAAGCEAPAAPLTPAAD
jgi:hypothetical protein